jgi:Family of unknown function (DUF5906)
MPARKRKADLSEEELAAEERKQEVIARVESLDPEHTREFLFTLCDRWQIQYPNRTFAEIMDTAFRNFEVPVDQMAMGDDPSNNFGLDALDARIHTHEMEALATYHHLRRHRLIGLQGEVEHEDNGAESTQLLNKIIKVLEMIFYSKRAVLSMFQSKLALQQVHCSDMTLEGDIDTRLGAWSLRFRWIDTNTTPMQEALLFLLDTAFEHKLRKQDGYVFEPITTQDGFNTHAFRQKWEIEEWIHIVTRKEVQWQQWVNITQGASTMKSIVAHLNTCEDYQFPYLVKDRTVFSFRNGVYMASTGTFYDFRTATEPLADSIVACKYFDTEFDPYTELHDWRLIPTPNLQSIFEYQGMPDSVCNWVYILLGRMLYDLNEHDGWQVILFLKGQAGTGKSTICTSVVKHMYDSIDVGVLSNNMERKFGLSAFYDKNVFIAPECRNDLSIEQAEFQSMVSGEDIQVNYKHKKAFSVKWRVPGILAGNEVPTWADAAGSIQRRLVVIDFERPVVDGDMRLGEKLVKELPDILVKCNRAYREMAAQHGCDNIWTLLPPYFKGTSSELAKTINSLEAFMGSDEVTIDPDAAVPFDEFKNALVAYAQINGFDKPKTTTDYFRGPFTRHGIRRERTSRVWRGSLFSNREFLIGLDLAVSDFGNALG